MTTSEKVAALQDARARIADPARWTQFRYARDASGHGAAPESPLAVCWCATGSLIKTACLMTGRSYGELFRELGHYVGVGGVLSVNDAHGSTPEAAHAAVLALYDGAIARLQAEASA